MEVIIPAVKDGILDKNYGILTEEKDTVKCGIPKKSFEIRWKGLPEGTKSIALIYIDYDNAQDEGVPWVHWTAADIPADWEGLKENQSESGDGFSKGHNSWSIPYAPYDDIDETLTVGFGGPAPERCHEYELEVYALDCLTGLKEGFYINDLRKAMRGHILEKNTVLMKYIGK